MEGPDARNTIYMRAQQAIVTFALGDAAAAVRELRAAVALIESLVPKDGHYMLADVSLSLGRALLQAGDATAALTEFRYAREYRQKTLGPSHPQVGLAACDLALAFAAAGQDDQARPMLESCAPHRWRYEMMGPASRTGLTRLFDRLNQGRRTDAGAPAR